MEAFTKNTWCAGFLRLYYYYMQNFISNVILTCTNSKLVQILVPGQSVQGSLWDQFRALT